MEQDGKPANPMSLQNKRVAVLESRLGEHLVELIRREGALPLHAPALAEVPDTDPELLGAFLDACAARAPDLFVFQTGVGTRALFDGAQALGREAELHALVANARVAVRGPKPTAVLRGKQVRIDVAAGDPHTTHELITELDTLALADAHAVVQRHGETNLELDRYLRERGAAVVELPLYRWTLPDDTQPLSALLDALDQRNVDALVFTSAAQVGNLLEFARRQGREAELRESLTRPTIVSIGPVCTRALEAEGIAVHAEARPPKLGPLMVLLRERL
jgi:uroporphyrinogen-III synthase